MYLDLGQEMNVTMTRTYSNGTVRNLNASTQCTTYDNSGA